MSRRLLSFVAPTAAAHGEHSSIVDVAQVTDLIVKQHWCRLKAIIADAGTGPSHILVLLFDSGVAASTLLRYFRWSDRFFRSPHDLHLHCRLLHSLAAENCTQRSAPSYTASFAPNGTLPWLSFTPSPSRAIAKARPLSLPTCYSLPM
ncbi:hypothetical protein HPP92_007961 [Vanilla planifolia]|uniref:Uncharacterized protein n=1 Tax=Vanilla planifolia TaxID=51239 RepID=A0A835RIH8_VANPL|nr:hypothetical protein HPP92_007961 [Vanilla planifolia]